MIQARRLVVVTVLLWTGAATDARAQDERSIDLVMRDRWSFRYSFSEMISGNPISSRLTPPGERNLANFQNLFGVTRRF